MDRAEIERKVGDGLRAMVLGETPLNAFKFTITPSKSIADGGLGVNAGGWNALLVRLKDGYLPGTAPYASLVINDDLVGKTWEKQLRSARYQITEQLAAL